MPAAVTKERLAMITGLQLVLSNHIESESEELRIAECLRGSSCELVATSSGSIRASMPAAATGSVAAAAAPGPATCLPAYSHQLRPSVQQSSHSKWELCGETEELFIHPVHLAIRAM